MACLACDYAEKVGMTQLKYADLMKISAFLQAWAIRKAPHLWHTTLV